MGGGEWIPQCWSGQSGGHGLQSESVITTVLGLMVHSVWKSAQVLSGALDGGDGTHELHLGCQI